MTSIAELENEIRIKARRQAELKVKGREFVDRVKDAAVSHSPVGNTSDGDRHPGRYAGAWHVKEGRPVDGMPTWSVVNDDPNAERVEFGTGVWNPRKQGGNSPAHGVRAKTAAEFGGDESEFSVE